MSMPAPAPATEGPIRRNREELLFLVLVIVLAGVAGVGCWFAAAALSRHDAVRGIAPDHPRQLVAFSLTNSEAEPVTRADVQGKFLVVSFLFTGCSLTCPEVSRHMAEIQRLEAGATDVRLLSLTVDPRSDTPPVLAAWGAKYGAESNQWWLLTGPRAMIHELIGTSFLPTNGDDPFNTMPGNFTGTDRIALVDRHGRLRMFFDGLRVETPGAVVAEIEQLRKED